MYTQSNRAVNPSRRRDGILCRPQSTKQPGGCQRTTWLLHTVPKRPAALDTATSTIRWPACCSYWHVPQLLSMCAQLRGCHSSPHQTAAHPLNASSWAQTRQCSCSACALRPPWRPFNGQPASIHPHLKHRWRPPKHVAAAAARLLPHADKTHPCAAAAKHFVATTDRLSTCAMAPLVTQCQTARPAMLPTADGRHHHTQTRLAYSSWSS
jgi:hypothetical protein